MGSELTAVGAGCLLTFLLFLCLFVFAQGSFKTKFFIIPVDNKSHLKSMKNNRPKAASYENEWRPSDKAAPALCPAAFRRKNHLSQAAAYEVRDLKIACRHIDQIKPY